MMRPVAGRKGDSGVKTLPVPSTHPEKIRSDLSRSTATQTVFLDITQTLSVSFVPELFLGMSDRPAYLETAWELFKEDLQLDRLDDKTRRMIALAISTDAAGHYCIATYPRAFRLNALDQTICDKIVLTIRFFRAFDRYLSGVLPHSIPDTSAFLTDCLRDEYYSFEATRANILLSLGHHYDSASTRSKSSLSLRGPLLLSIAALVLYLYLH